MLDHAFEVETLERRQMLAGNVDVEVTASGDLVLRGDEADNSVLIDGSRLVGLDATTITLNGEVADEVTLDVLLFRDIRADFKSGNDSIRVLDVTVTDDVTVKGGDGADEITLRDVVVGDKVRIEGGRGDHRDIIQLDETMVAGDVRVTTGNSNPMACPGRDDIQTTDNLIGGKLSIRTGRNGAQIEMIGDTIEGRTSIKTGNGNDFIELKNVDFIDNLSVSASQGDDYVRLIATETNNGLQVKLAAGDDEFYNNSAIVVGGSVRIDGGSGFDTTFRFDPSPLSQDDFRKFEQFGT